MVSVGDDFLGRCWRDGRSYGRGDGAEARDLRADHGRRGELEGGRRWLAGWAGVKREGWDGDEWD